MTLMPRQGMEKDTAGKDGLASAGSEQMGAIGLFPRRSDEFYLACEFHARCTESLLPRTVGGWGVGGGDNVP